MERPLAAAAVVAAAAAAAAEAVAAAASDAGGGTGVPCPSSERPVDKALLWELHLHAAHFGA